MKELLTVVIESCGYSFLSTLSAVGFSSLLSRRKEALLYLLATIITIVNRSYLSLTANCKLKFNACIRSTANEANVISEGWKID